MGEANKKKRRKEAFLKEHPFCCFCGGAAPATTWDHVPSRQMFDGRRRPKGLEVPACMACNSATSRYEQIAAMCGRIFPDATDPSVSEETAKIIKAVNRSDPGLLEEMQASPEQMSRLPGIRQHVPQAAGVLNCNGPLLNQAVEIFGAKLGFALHYWKTGRIVPKGGGVSVRWYTNYNFVDGSFPEHILSIMGAPVTLRQGSQSVAEQFRFGFAIPETQEMGAYLSTFRLSFAVLSWVSEDAKVFPEAARPVLKPGCFQDLHKAS